MAEDVLASLESRLVTALVGEQRVGPSEVANAHDVEARCEMADRINQVTVRVAVLAENIRTLNRRVDL